MYTAAVRRVRLASRAWTATHLCLHGSVVSGETTVERHTGLPLSDVDLLVVGPSLSSLATAAQSLAGVDAALRRPEAPLFQLGVKFRLFSELSPPLLSANELGALTWGQWIRGRPLGISSPLSNGWFRKQAILALHTRLCYDADRIQRLNGAASPGAHRSYIIARTILELPTIGLLSKGLLFASYQERVDRFLRLMAPEGVRMFGAVLQEALRLKRSPSFPTELRATTARRFLVAGARRIGLEIKDDDLPSSAFWSTHRPLDVRDREIWARAQE